MARHLPIRERRPPRTRGSCRGAHLYEPGQQIGAGILRYLCSACGAVSIDLSAVDGLTDAGSLFEPAEGTLGRT